jgi:hypothetical protein
VGAERDHEEERLASAGSIKVNFRQQETYEMMRIPEHFKALFTYEMVRCSVHQEHDQQHPIYQHRLPWLREY